MSSATTPLPPLPSSTRRPPTTNVRGERRRDTEGKRRHGWETRRGDGERVDEVDNHDDDWRQQRRQQEGDQADPPSENGNNFPIGKISSQPRPTPVRDGKPACSPPAPAGSSNSLSEALGQLMVLTSRSMGIPVNHKYLPYLRILDSWLRVIRENKLAQIRVWLWNTQLLASTDPGHPRVHSWSALDTMPCNLGGRLDNVVCWSTPLSKSFLLGTALPMPMLFSLERCVLILVVVGLIMTRDSCRLPTMSFYLVLAFVCAVMTAWTNVEHTSMMTMIVAPKTRTTMAVLKVNNPNTATTNCLVNADQWVATKFQQGIGIQRQPPPLVNGRGLATRTGLAAGLVFCGKPAGFTGKGLWVWEPLPEQTPPPPPAMTTQL
ncbi:hypothetical protein CPC08DRAFT_729201 [Agrocybe pediades]|nr:hypothetical protein CPC08DRAFT_729201 [Agrocybe pediades]